MPTPSHLRTAETQAERNDRGAMTTVSTSTAETGDITTITVAGELDAGGALALRRALLKVSTGAPDAILVDISRMSVSDDRYLIVLATIAQRTAGRRLILYGAPPDVSRRLRTHPVLRLVRTLPDRETALAALPDSVVNRFVVECLPTRQAPALGRDLVGRACAAWRLERLTTDAELIISELCANAVRHARTPMRIVVTRTERHLHLAVHDRSPDPPELIRPSSTTPPDSGRGLLLVEAYATAWGVLPTADGKKVWATLRLSHANSP